MHHKIYLLSSMLVLLAGCSNTMKSDFDCRVPNQGVCDSLGEVNRLVNSGYFNNNNNVPRPDFESTSAIWIADENESN